MNTQFLEKRVAGLKVLECGTKHAVRYIFYRPGEPLKSGIASEETFNEYNSHTIRTEGKSKIWAMWDEDFLHQDLDLCQAAEVIKKMDSCFKQIMKNEGYRSRDIRNTKSIGTEFYEIEGMDFDNQDDVDSVIEIIEATWKVAYKIAYEFVTKTELDPKEWIGEEFKPREGQDYLFIDPVVEFFKTYDKGTAESHGGTGKTKMSFRIAQLICKYVLKNGFKILVISDNINNTIQQAVEFSKFYKGQTGKRLTKSYIIGSPDSNNFNILQSWSTVISKSDPNLENILKDAVHSKQDCAFFVVNQSCEGFLKSAEKVAVDFKKFFTILDEIQQYSTENDQATIIDSERCAALRFNHLFGKKFGLSATHIERPETCTNPDAVFNDDLDKFGPKIVRIDEIKAREMGWICDKEALIAPIPETEEFIKSIQENRPLSLTVGDKTINIESKFFVAAEALMSMALPSGKTHILLLTPFIRNIEALGNMFDYFKEIGIIDEDVEIIRGYAKCGSSCVNRFNRAKKSIMIASRWIAVGQDTYNCDCIIPLYNPDSQAFKRQFSMRADRWKGDRTSLLIIASMESELSDNMWFAIAENMSNGEIPRIISSASVFEQEEINEDELNVDIGMSTTSNRHADGGGVVNSNITLREPRNRNPILFENWNLIARAIATRTYTDAYGNSKFSEIVNFRTKIELEEQVIRVEIIPNFLKWIDESVESSSIYGKRLTLDQINSYVNTIDNEIMKHIVVRDNENKVKKISYILWEEIRDEHGLILSKVGGSGGRDSITRGDIFKMFLINELDGINGSKYTPYLEKFNKMCIDEPHGVDLCISKSLAKQAYREVIYKYGSDLQKAKNLRKSYKEEWINSVFRLFVKDNLTKDGKVDYEKFKSQKKPWSRSTSLNILKEVCKYLKIEIHMISHSELLKKANAYEKIGKINKQNRKVSREGRILKLFNDITKEGWFDIDYVQQHKLVVGEKKNHKGKSVSNNMIKNLLDSGCKIGLFEKKLFWTGPVRNLKYRKKQKD